MAFTSIMIQGAVTTPANTAPPMVRVAFFFSTIRATILEAGMVTASNRTVNSTKTEMGTPADAAKITTIITPKVYALADKRPYQVRFIPRHWPWSIFSKGNAATICHFSFGNVLKPHLNTMPINRPSPTTKKIAAITDLQKFQFHQNSRRGRYLNVRSLRFPQGVCQTLH